MTIGGRSRPATPVVRSQVPRIRHTSAMLNVPCICQASTETTGPYSGPGEADEDHECCGDTVTMTGTFGSAGDQALSMGVLLVDFETGLNRQCVGGYLVRSGGVTTIGLGEDTGAGAQTQDLELGSLTSSTGHAAPASSDTLVVTVSGITTATLSLSVAYKGSTIHSTTTAALVTSYETMFGELNWAPSGALTLTSFRTVAAC